MAQDNLRDDHRVKALAELGTRGPASDTPEWREAHKELQGEGHSAHAVNEAIASHWTKDQQ